MRRSLNNVIVANESPTKGTVVRADLACHTIGANAGAFLNGRNQKDRKAMLANLRREHGRVAGDPVKAISEGKMERASSPGANHR